MDKEQIMTIILAEETLLYNQAKETADAFGRKDEATIRAYAQWYVITNLIEKINEETN
jgi:hypothetical protein